MFLRFMRWIRAQWEAYCVLRIRAARDLEIARAAVFLGLIDRGWAPEVFVKGHDEPMIKMHFNCPTRARVGITQSPTMCVYWCYRCRITWHFVDDDEGGGRKSFSPPSPRPIGWQSPPGMEESARVIRDLMNKRREPV